MHVFKNSDFTFDIVKLLHLPQFIFIMFYECIPVVGPFRKFNYNITLAIAIFHWLESNFVFFGES